MAITRVQGKTNQDWTGANPLTLVITFDAAVSFGSLVCGHATCGDNVGSDLRVTDNQLNTYTTFVTGGYDATNNQCEVGFYCANVTNAPTTLTLSKISAGQLIYTSITADEFSGVATTSPLTGTPVIAVQNSPGTGANVLTSGNTTPGENGALIYGFTQNDGGSTLATAGTSSNAFTSATLNATSASRSEYFIQTTAAAISATFGIAANESHITGVMVFKAAVTGDVSLALPSTGGATTSTAARGTQTPNLAVPL